MRCEGCKLRSPLLSGREKEILRLVAEGLSNQAIGETLTISVRTVVAHRGRVMQKLNFASVVDLVRYAVRNHLVDP
jgi:DNA-binding CsgD family transcriptional regulator